MFPGIHLHLDGSLKIEVCYILLLFFDETLNTGKFLYQKKEYVKIQFTDAYYYHNAFPYEC